jgi:hypothetical protein
MNDKNMLADLHQPEPTLAKRLQFHLQFMGVMGMAGREDERDKARHCAGLFIGCLLPQNLSLIIAYDGGQAVAFLRSKGPTINNREKNHEKHNRSNRRFKHHQAIT